MIRLLIPLVLVGMVLTSCGPTKPPMPPPPVVAVAVPLTRDVVDWDDYVGQFVAVESVDVRPRVSGYLMSVGFRDGEAVRKGQVLFTIDPRPYQNTFDEAKSRLGSAKATAANAHQQLQRGETLLQAKAISQQAFDLLHSVERQDNSAVTAAEATVRAAQLNLDFTRVTAPISGRVSDRRIAPGNLVTADNTVLTNIVNLDPIRFAFTGSEALYLKYQRENLEGTRASSRRAANPVEIRLQDEPTFRWKGHMEFVDNSLDPASGTIRGRALVANADHFLTPGMFGHMRLLGSGAYHALLIPDQAVVADQERQVVFVIDAHGFARMQPVTLGPIAVGLRVVRSGLGPADRVVISGVQRVQSGHKVDARTGQILARDTDAEAVTATAPIASTAQSAASR